MRVQEGTPPREGRHFYSIQLREGGRGADVYLMPDRGVTLIVRGVTPWDGLEDDIRARYYDWCAVGEILTL